jgi:hypothetical protein
LSIIVTRRVRRSGTPEHPARVLGGGDCRADPAAARLIGERHRLDEFKRDVEHWSRNTRIWCRDSGHRHRVVPAGGDVMVVSKGDSTLLQFEGRPALIFRQPTRAFTRLPPGR